MKIKPNILLTLSLLLFSCRGVSHTPSQAAGHSDTLSHYGERGNQPAGGGERLSAMGERPLFAVNPDDYVLWGHNLKKALGDNPAFYAVVDGKPAKDQLCFSSVALYKSLKTYIADNDTAGRYTIMPLDNDLVCLCPECQKAGNSKQNATPAVTSLLLKLANDFPYATFYTSAYRTTLQPSAISHQPLAPNIGVFLAANTMQLRSSFKERKGFAEFDALLDRWKQLTDNICIWEYTRNFDDYFTPFPCLEALRCRFLYYQEKGVRGVFLNDSGSDYATFGDLQAYVLKKLLQDPTQEVEPLVNEFLKREYPKTWQIISAYYLSLEDRVRRGGNYLPLYADITELVEYYLQPEPFEQFRATLERASKTVAGPERKRLNLLLTALNFTRLELIRTGLRKYSEQDREDAIEVMRGALETEELQNYKETNGSIAGYLSLVFSR